MLDSSRHQWDDGLRRLESYGDETVRARHLLLLVDAVTDEIRRRIGQTFTLAELAEEYGRSEDWVQDTVRTAMPAKGRAGLSDTALVQDAAFGRYARGATDYEP